MIAKVVIFYAGVLFGIFVVSLMAAASKDGR